MGNSPTFSKSVPIDPCCSGPGIYRLIDDTSGVPVVVYVGKAKSVPTRVICHIQEGAKIFNAFDYYLAPDADEYELIRLESEEIFRTRPRYNRGLRETPTLLTFGSLCETLGISRAEMRDVLAANGLQDYLGVFDINEVKALFPGRAFKDLEAERRDLLKQAQQYYHRMRESAETDTGPEPGGKA